MCFICFTEAQKALLSVITATKDTISDPEKHMGRFTREDKVCLSSVLHILFNSIELYWGQSQKYRNTLENKENSPKWDINIWRVKMVGLQDSN